MTVAPADQTLVRTVCDGALTVMGFGLMALIGLSRQPARVMAGCPGRLVR